MQGKNVLFLIFLFFFLGCVQVGDKKKLYPAAFIEQKPQWTIMVYMNGDNSLNDYTDMDIQEMVKAELDESIKIIILRDKANNGDTKLLRIQNNAIEYLSGTINNQYLSPTSLVELNMLDAQTLNDFIVYAQSNYPADYYALVLWGHSDGWRNRSSGDNVFWKGLTNDDHPNTGSLSNQQIASQLLGKKIDVISFDSCLQGTLETLWTFKKAGFNGILIGSVNTIPASGWNYYRFLSYFKESYRRVSDFGEIAVKSYQETYEQWNNQSLVVYRLSELNLSLLQNFFIWVENNQASEKTIFQSTEKFLIDSRYYYHNFYQYLNNTAYPNKNELKTMLEKMVWYSWTKTYGNHYPALTIMGIIGTWDNTYDSIPLSIDSRWNEIIFLWK